MYPYPRTSFRMCFMTLIKGRTLQMCESLAKDCIVNALKSDKMILH